MNAPNDAQKAPRQVSAASFFLLLALFIGAVLAVYAAVQSA